MTSRGTERTKSGCRVSVFESCALKSRVENRCCVLINVSAFHDYFCFVLSTKFEGPPLKMEVRRGLLTTNSRLGWQLIQAHRDFCRPTIAAIGLYIAQYIFCLLQLLTMNCYHPGGGQHQQMLTTRGENGGRLPHGFGRDVRST